MKMVREESLFLFLPNEPISDVNYPCGKGAFRQGVAVQLEQVNKPRDGMNPGVVPGLLIVDFSRPTCRWHLSDDWRTPPKLRDRKGSDDLSRYFRPNPGRLRQVVVERIAVFRELCDQRVTRLPRCLDEGCETSRQRSSR